MCQVNNYKYLYLIISVFNKYFCFQGPGKYAPEKTNLDKTPQYSFGLRPDISKPSNVPGKKIII